MFESKRNLRILFVGIPLAIVGLAAVFILIYMRPIPPLAMPPQPVIMGTVQTRDITESREYVAVMEADHSVDLRARVSGFLVAKNFQDGDLVKKDQLLFQIEPDQYQALLATAEASVLSARAQFDRASLDFNRIKDLYDKKTSPKSDFDRAKADYEVAEAALKSARAGRTQAALNLGYASIKAPFDGRISDTPYSEGSLLGPESGVLATVVSLDPILATFGISEKVISQYQTEMKNKNLSAADWQVRLRLAPDVCYPEPGPLSYAAPTVDPRTDTIKFKAKFANADKLLRPGQIVTAIVERIKPDLRLVVPKEAVLTDTEGRFVYMVREVPADPEKPGSRPGLAAEPRRVTLEQGDPLDKDYIVKDGLEEGEQFILKGLMSGGATLRAGAPVQVATPDQGQGPAPGPGHDEKTEPAAKDGGQE